MAKQKIIFMDQTLREGMQHRGIVFSNKEKQEIFRFQQRLGVDICQAGYVFPTGVGCVSVVDNSAIICNLSSPQV